MRSIKVILVSIMVVSSAASAFAHDDYRVVGTIIKAQPTLLVIKGRDGEVYNMKMDKETAIKRDKQEVVWTELKPGRSVVVDASGDSVEDLMVLAVRLVPPISSGK